MRTNRVIVVALLALAIFGAGVIVGERLGSRRAAANPFPTKSAPDGVHGTHLPGMNVRPRAGNSGTPAASGESGSVAEIEAAQSVNASARQSVIQRPRLAGRLDD